MVGGLGVTCPLLRISVGEALQLDNIGALTIGIRFEGIVSTGAPKTLSIKLRPLHYAGPWRLREIL